MQRVIARGAARTRPPSRRRRRPLPLCPTDPLPPHGLRARRGAGSPERGGGCVPRPALGRGGGGGYEPEPAHPSHLQPFRGVVSGGCVHVREPGPEAGTGSLLRETRGNSGLLLAMESGVIGKYAFSPAGQLLRGRRARGAPLRSLTHCGPWPSGGSRAAGGTAPCPLF